MKRKANKCGFCERQLSREEQTTKRNAAGLCHECYYLRRIVWRMGWEETRAPVVTSEATERWILSWFGGQGDTSAK